MAEHTSPFEPEPDKRSPFPNSSLPQAGESLQVAAENLFFEKFFVYLSAAITVASIAAVEWLLRRLNLPMPPWALPVVAVGFAALAAWRWIRIKPQLKMLRQGIRGEREVGRMLEDFRRLGYVVFHDIPGDGFNIDHALVGPGGVFAIETKTLSMPAGRRATIDYNGTRVLIDGKTPQRDPVAQTAAVADYLREILKRMTGREVAVRPVVLFPGWWVNQQRRDNWVWVLNPKAMGKFLEHEPTKL